MTTLTSFIKDMQNKGLKIALLYLSVVGLISGTCFIIEESIQTSIFANFSATDTNRYDLVLKNLNQIERVNYRLRVINWALLVIQPIAWFGYDSFSDSTDLYIDTLEAEILAHEPRLLEGREVDIRFRYTSLVSASKELVWCKGAKLKVLLKKSDVPSNRIIEQTSVLKFTECPSRDPLPEENKQNTTENLKAQFGAQIGQVYLLGR